MSDGPINLNKARKARARVAKRAQADANAVAFGRTKAEKAADRGEASRMARDLDGKALASPPKGTGKDVQKP